MSNDNLIERACSFAAKVHFGQVRPNKAQEPYENHLKREKEVVRISTLKTQGENIAVIRQAIEVYKSELVQHPIGGFCTNNLVPLEILHQFARAQYVDSILWVPMLSTILGRIQEPRLIEAVKANIACETGYAGNVPHPTVCARFLKSLDISIEFDNIQHYSPISAYTINIMKSVSGMSEPALCGWLITSEELVPPLFQLFRSAFASIDGCDLEYIDEHIVVDAEEHAVWMWESAEALLAKKDCVNEILIGLNIGVRVVLSIPDILYTRCLIFNVSANKQEHHFRGLR